jgi:tetratricopeptide (TPR) repeat protein/quercetin dioxygenase-like cupin family protein
VKVRQIAEELGVRYVLEGSVRRAEDKIRINAQLIDATTGGHVWAERYDGSLTDVFALQDKITRSIVTALAVNLTTGEQERQARQETESAEAYDAFLRGWAHYQLHTPDDLAKAIPYFENAIELDPSFGHAHAALAATYRAVWDNLWAKKVGVSYPEADEKMRRHLEAALSKPTPLAHRMAAKMYSATKRWDEAIAEAERAIALDANDPNGYEEMSRLLVKAGRPSEALDFIDKAMRLDPQTDYLYRLGDAQFHLGRYEEAAATFLRATKRNPDDEWNFLLLAAAYGHLGREQEAKSAIDRFSEKRTKEERQYTSLSNLAFTDFKEQIDSKRLLEGLRKAGLPVGGAEPSVVKGKFSVPVNHSEVAQDWNTRSYSCNLYLADRGWVSRNHKHPSDEIVTVVEGRVALIIGDKRFEAGPGDELLIPSHTRHRLENLHDGDLIIPYGLRVDVGTPSNKCQ